MRLSKILVALNTISHFSFAFLIRLQFDGSKPVHFHGVSVSFKRLDLDHYLFFLIGIIFFFSNIEVANVCYLTFLPEAVLHGC